MAQYESWLIPGAILLSVPLALIGAFGGLTALGIPLNLYAQIGLGVLPLVLASGAGAASRVSLGAAVFFGMLASAVLGTLMVPAAFAAVQTFREWAKGLGKKPTTVDTDEN